MAEGVPADAGGAADSRMKKDAAEVLLNLSPARLVLLVAALVIIGESVSTALLRLLPPFIEPLPVLIDAVTHLLVLLPAYFFLFLPLRSQYAERRRAEREVAFLSRHVIRAVEEERKRLASDLHDECGQLVTALQLGIETMKYSLPAHAATTEQCDRLASLTSQMGDQVRSLTARLRPAMLETCGLVPTLRWHVGQFRHLWPELTIDLQIDDCSERFASEIEITVYRLCQEGLNNIIKHAGARKATLLLTCSSGIELRIIDDGCGFDPKRTRSCEPVPRGFGLLGMRERVADLGGRLTIWSAPGLGTVIEAQLPLKGRSAGC
jgi:signal transduction histidine kinase